MWIENLFNKWRQNVALHATLVTKSVAPVDKETRTIVMLEHLPDDAASVAVKFGGKTEKGIECYVNIELIGPPDLLNLFQFREGQHVGLVIRAID